MISKTASVDVHADADLLPLRRLIHAERDLWTPAQLRELTTKTAAELGTPLLRLARFVPEKRWWARLALTTGVELWLLSWLPGQGTRPHDHGGAAGAFTVLSGSLSENYRYPGGPIRHAHRHQGAAVGFGAGHAHQMTNRGHLPASSVHAYSPPLVPTREYRSLHEIPAEIPPLATNNLPLAELLALIDHDEP
ncbi:cysteine dioxygenase [Amycolatopsis taiwanensis]|uniref:Cysteine dioxygenase n=1 Tax=Amycolatopsis taiwanensis TaxID=342230 RepID=A0A9W6VM37_9PSEU|nr:cysteine dioxygenase family protein [Amycolatopsis taiwanensis]GLY71136.1 cysteine dioxygenase [Amycolatopsis taiwanensis]